MQAESKSQHHCPVEVHHRQVVYRPPRDFSYSQIFVDFLVELKFLPRYFF
jgi:hypothetical protein